MALDPGTYTIVVETGAQGDNVVVDQAAEPDHWATTYLLDVSLSAD